LPDTDPAAGRLVVLVGPSGVGKDTVLDGLRARLSGNSEVRFVQRTVTRPTSAGGEDHLSLTDAAFTEAELAGAFSVTWRANGLSYGWPAELHGFISEGGIAIANGSRQALPAIRAAFPGLLILAITASEEILRQRLQARGRENSAQIEARLARGRELAVAGPDVVVVDNGGPAEVAVEKIVAMLEDLRSHGH